MDEYEYGMRGEAPEPEAPTQHETRRAGARLRIWLFAIAAALLCAILGGVCGSFMTASRLKPPVTAAAQTGAGAALTTPVTAQSGPSPAVSPAEESRKSLTPREVFNACAESVVGVSNETTTNVFGQASAVASSGTGFILTADGYIITNHHVVQDAEKLTVVLHSGARCAAEVVGSDAGNDIALLKIAQSGLKPVSIGNSDTLQVGEAVCAIGNPLGELTNTLTAGYLSALDREINTDGAPINMLQTDCAINAGNSGGPLFDMNGDVIAITTAKYYGDTVEGLGFAIPINDAVKIAADLREYGYVVGRPKLGVTILDLDAQMASLYGLPVGAYVHAVEPESCAAQAGVQERDILTAIGDYPVETKTDLSAALKNFRAGDTTTLQIVRGGTSLTLPITLDERLPETGQATAKQTEKAETTGISPG